MVIMEVDKDAGDELNGERGSREGMVERAEGMRVRLRVDDGGGKLVRGVGCETWADVFMQQSEAGLK
jgi:hypothetical protein